MNDLVQPIRASEREVMSREPVEVLVVRGDDLGLADIDVVTCLVCDHRSPG